jgi:hypothetical protein
VAFNRLVGGRVVEGGFKGGVILPMEFDGRDMGGGGVNGTGMCMRHCRCSGIVKRVGWIPR